MSAHILVAAVTSWVRTGAVSGPLPLALMQALVASDQPACPSLGLQTTATACVCDTRKGGVLISASSQSLHDNDILPFWQSQGSP